MGEKRIKNKNPSLLENNSRTLTENQEDFNQRRSQEMQRELELNKMKKTLESIEKSIISDVQQKIDVMIEEIIQQIKRYELNANEFKDFAQQQHQLLWSNRYGFENKTIANNCQSDKNTLKQQNQNNNESSKEESLSKIHMISHNKRNKKLPEKIFIPRNSYLTCLLEVTHMKCIYHIFLVILTVLFLHTIIHDYVAEGKINIGQDTIVRGFGKLHLGLIIWSIMQLCTFGVYYVFKLWAIIRFHLRNYKFLQKLWNFSYIFLYSMYQYYFAYFVSIYVIKLDLAFVTSVSVLLEMVRFMMKTHAFIRTNVPLQFMNSNDIATNCNDDDDDDNDDDKHKKYLKQINYPVITKFSKYLYFLFAPTLIYREEYPRTKIIRWQFVIKRLTEVISTMFFQAFFFEKYLLPTFYNFGKEQITYGNLLVSIFNMMMPGLMIFLSSFYVLLHSWLNATSELLYFADRMFYKDWWTCKNYESYYRNWNVVIHDWLYEYVYKDCYLYIFNGSKGLSALVTFTLSAIVHEYILAIGLGFVFPFLFFSFGIFSVTLTFLMKKYEHDFGNFILWLTLSSGNGIIVSLYSMEYYSRHNCPIENLTWIDYVIPRLLSCNGIVDNNNN